MTRNVGIVRKSKLHGRSESIPNNGLRGIRHSVEGNERSMAWDISFLVGVKSPKWRPQKLLHHAEAGVHASAQACRSDLAAVSGVPCGSGRCRARHFPSRPRRVTVVLSAGACMRLLRHGFIAVVSACW